MSIVSAGEGPESIENFFIIDGFVAFNESVQLAIKKS